MQDTPDPVTPEPQSPAEAGPDGSATVVAPPAEPELPDRLLLAGPEDRHSRAEWEAATAAVLRKTRALSEDDPDSAVWDRLTRTTLDDIPVAPVGGPEAVERLTTSGRPHREGSWDVRVALNGTADAVNAEALADLDTGATSLWVGVDGDLPAQDLERALSGVLLDLAPVVLQTRSGDPLEAARELVRLLDGTVPAPGTNLGVDPLGALLTAGAPGEATADSVAELTVAAAELARGAGTLGLVVDGTAAHDLGASDGQELGWSMAAGLTLLRALEAAGWAVDDAAALVEFRLAATDEQFPTIAKLRAARRLWSRVVEASGGAATTPQRQHAVTSRPMMGKYDPWVNMLRTTVAAFAAGAAGADSVTVLPFDSVLGRPEAFGRRIARNTSTLLIEEAHVAAVTDPAGGAYAVERLTDDLAVAGWAELGRIEQAGGALAALADGSLRSRIDEVVARRDQEVATRRRPLTGVSEFPNLAETLPDRAGDADGVRRYGAAFEAMRDEPAGSPVFLATLGPIAAHTARATFAANLLAAGGVPVDIAGPTDGTESLVSAYAGQRVACLAGTDAAYGEWGAAAVAALREAGAGYVVLAGKPGERTVAADLVDDSCAMGVDALAFLTRVREQLA